MYTITHIEDDTIYGSDEDDIIIGEAGLGTLNKGNGNGVLEVGDGTDRIQTADGSVLDYTNLNVMIQANDLLNQRWTKEVEFLIFSYDENQ